MQLDIYWTTLLVLLPTVIILTGRNIIIRPLARIQSRWQKVNTEDKLEDDSSKLADETEPRSTDDDLRKFRRGFLSIYLLVMSSEWLSGPYLYALLRDDRALPEPVVVGLYATAYTSAAVSALGVGFLADRYGRRKACLAQCLIHSCACLTVVFGGDCLPVLFLGRVLAGTGLTLLWTVFESWMNENFGVEQQLSESNQEFLAPEASGTGWLGDGRIWALTFVTCCFEGTAFLVIFLWPSVLQGAHEAASADADPVEIPYGVIFGSFMAAMIIGALFFSTSSKAMKTPAAPVWLLLGAIFLACLSLLLLSVLEVEVPLYFSFLTFEVANGIYVPSMAYMRGLVVDSKSRAGIYGLMKIPLFIFVILALGITAEGKGFRCFVFASSSMSLLCAAVALLVEFRASLSGSGGSGHVLQGRIEGGDVLHDDSESKEDGVNREGEGGLGKRLDVSP
ncbi:hypothetical protein SLS64_006066 [Diaporthe eres]|uniref:Molybdate-anion transporter n=1 Tax=Diaporthe eres TaxID=83184 RepID=A0ABR1P8G6_DIAER